MTDSLGHSDSVHKKRMLGTSQASCHLSPEQGLLEWVSVPVPSAEPVKGGLPILSLNMCLLMFEYLFPTHHLQEILLSALLSSKRQIINVF